VAAVLVALFVLFGQVAAVLPVAWLSPLQMFVLASSTMRDTLGAWNIVLAIAAMAVGVWTLRRGGRRRLPVTVSAMSGTALLLVLITTAVQVVTVHGVTGQWCPFSPATPGSSVGRGPATTVTYATIEGQALKADLYLPKTSSAAPLVVSIHGGGFISGSRGRTPYTSWLADNGYAVLDVDYRLATATQHTWDTADADVGCAMTWAIRCCSTWVAAAPKSAPPSCRAARGCRRGSARSPGRASGSPPTSPS